MSMPFMPTCGFPVTSASSQEVYEKFSVLGLQIGYDNGDFWTMKSPSEVHNAKVFYIESSVNPGRYQAYAVSNYSIGSNHIWCVRWNNETSLFDFIERNVQTPGEGISGHTVYYGALTGYIPLEKLNPIIPVCSTLEDGLQQADREGWIYVNPDNPYEFDPDAISYAGGGNGSFDNTSDSVGVPSLPTLSAVSAGFIAMYSPTLTQLNQLASFLWTDNMFDPDNFKKLFTDPMECIIGLTIVPVNPTSAGSTNVKVGYVDTGISMPRLSSQYAEVDCGTIKAQEFWGSALDYAPMTRIHLYLPYIGIREINADEVMNKSIGVVYHIDLLSGALTAFVTANGSVLYQFNGQCALNVPMASSNFTHMIQGAITSIGSVTAGIATGGSSVGAGMALSAIQIGASAANNAISNKPSFSHSGSMGGAGGMLGVQTPYLIIDRPRQSMPEGMNKFCGFPSNIYYKLFDLEGFTQVEYIHLDNVPATGAELDEIEGLLRKGVIL